MFSSLLKKFVKKVINYIDLLLIIPLLISFPAFYIFARIGGKRLKLSRKLLKNLGIYPKVSLNNGLKNTLESLEANIE